MKRSVICIGRDGTLIHDTTKHLFLDRDGYWQEMVQLHPFAVEGLGRKEFRKKNGLNE